MFLYLKKKYPEQFLVPCYDNDLIWHTHQVSTLHYVKDTMNVLGMVLPHDDSVNERSKGSKLDTSSDETARLWQDTFEVPFGRPGCMFRGEPPYLRLGLIKQPLVKSIINQIMMCVHVKSIKIHDKNGNYLPKEGYIRLYLARKSTKIQKLGDVQDFKSQGTQIDLQVNQPFQTNHEGRPMLGIKIKKSTTFGKKLVSKIEPIDLFAQLPKPIHEGLPSEEIALAIKAGSSKTLEAEIELTITQMNYLTKPYGTILSIHLESFGPTLNVSNQLDLWGPVNVPKIIPNELQDAHETSTL